MEVSGYPFLDVHRAEHQRFKEYFARLVKEADSAERLFLIFKVQVFLSDWFAGHSTGMDRHLAVYLKARAR